MIFGQSGFYKAIHSESNLWRAWRAVRRGSPMAGPDGVTVDAFERELFAHLKTLQSELQHRSYSPGPTKHFELPKDDGGPRPHRSENAKRAIAVRSVRDRVVERALHQEVSHRVDPKFDHRSHAFRPGRSTSTAVQRLVRQAGAERHWFGHLDIASCFPSLDHRILRRQLRSMVKKRDVRRLIMKFVTSANSSDQDGKGIMQGGALSPLLCNIYLHRLDQRLDRTGLHFVRYADNILFVTASREAAKKGCSAVTKALKKIKLRPNKRKTLTTHFARGVAVLGYLLVEPKGHPDRVIHRDLYQDQEEGEDEMPPAGVQSLPSETCREVE